MDTQELIKEAYRRYPVGTVFIPAHTSDSAKTVTVLQNETFQASGSNIHLYTTAGIHFCDRKNTHIYNQTVYADGTWAQIVSSPPLSKKDCSAGQRVQILNKTRGIYMTQAKMQRIMASKDYDCYISEVYSSYLEIVMTGNGEKGIYEFNYSDVSLTNTPTPPKSINSVKKDYKSGDRVLILDKTLDCKLHETKFSKLHYAEVNKIADSGDFVRVKFYHTDGTTDVWNFNFTDIKLDTQIHRDVIKKDYAVGDRVRILAKTKGTKFNDSGFQSVYTKMEYATVKCNYGSGYLDVTLHLIGGGTSNWEFNYQDVTPKLGTVDKAVEVIQSIPVTIKDAVKNVLGIKEPEVVEDITIAPKKKISSAIVVESTSNITL